MSKKSAFQASDLFRDSCWGFRAWVLDEQIAMKLA
jgi:hypothetical protein